ncbi:MAG: glutamate racemase [Deferribacteraceae bacterium]|jgi:glutamate racemase|nr:glutamate racemase [Deferribacteraceae bacterium]
MSLGIFDSGVGGLTVYRELAKQFPDTDLIYLGDTARVPYGNKSPDTIIRYATECASMLVKRHNVDALVVACNTISSYAIENLRSTFGLPVLGVIEAGAEMAMAVTKNNKIGVLGTIATVRSGAYIKALEEVSDGKAIVSQRACPLFVPLVEEGVITGEIPSLVIKMYLDELIADVDTLLLGCTHYPVLAPLLASIYPEVNIADSASMMVEHILAGGLATIESGKREIYVTDITPAFESLKSMLVGDIPMQEIDI